MNKDNHIRINEAAKILGVSSKTLRRWSTSGKLIPERSAGGHRYYTYNQLRELNYQLPINNDQPINNLQFTIYNDVTKLRHIKSSICYKLSIKHLAIGFLSILITTLAIGTWKFNNKSLKTDNCKFNENCKLKIENSAPVVLGASSPTLTINVPTVFNDSVTFGENVVLPNVIYSVKAGDGLSVGSGQKPTISNTGVLSLNTSTGALSLTAGGGISVSGLSISNSDLGSSQNIFKTISVLGQSDVVTDTNSDALTLAGATGISITTDATNDKITLSADGNALNVSGWTDSGTKVYTTALTDLVGIGTATPSYNLHVIGTESVTGLTTLASTLGVTGATTFSGNMNVAGNTTLGSDNTDIITFTGHLAGGTVIAPLTDLQADLGTSGLRFNNLFVTNLNSESGLTTSGQATFTYTPTDTTFGQASVLINPTGSVANGQLLGFGVAGYQRAGFDAEGDLSLGYNGLVSAPISNYQFTIYNHGTTAVTTVDTSGNIATLGSLDINGTTSDIAGALNLSGNSLTSSGALTITPATGQNLNISLSNSLFTVDSSQFTVNSSTGFVGVGTATASAQLDVAGIAQTDAIAISNSGTKVLGISYGTNNANINLLSSDPTNKLTNGTFESNLTSWNSTQQYSLEDQFTTSAPTTLVSGGLSAPTPSLGSELVTNGDMSSSTGWTLGSGWSIGSGIATVVASTNTNLTQAITTLGNWYKITFDITTRSAGVLNPTLGGSFGTSVSSVGSYVYTGRAAGTSAGLAANSTANLSADNVSVKPLTLSSLFSTVVETTANKIISTGVTLTAGTQAGIVINADATFANFIIAYHDGTNIHLDKNVGGTYTSLINTAATYSANATLKVIKLGNDYQLIYNGTKYGSTTTISDAGIINNTLQGLFSTYASNSFTNFLITTNLDGTSAEPTGGTRTVVDTTGQMSITGGVLTVAGGDSLWGHTGINYSGTSRTVGKILMDTFTPTDVTKYVFPLAFGRSATTNFASFANLAHGYYVSSSVLNATDNAAVGPSITSTLVNGTTYQLALILRSTGVFYYIKGGIYTNWTLLYISSVDSTATVYPAISNSNSVFTADNIRIPTSTWLPTPLAYDTFTRGDGAIGNSETTGPDSQTTPSLAWTGGAIVSNKLVITPSLGSEINTSANASSDPNANEANATTGWLVSAGDITISSNSTAPQVGTYNLRGTSSASSGRYIYHNYTTATVGAWYLSTFGIKSDDGNGQMQAYGFSNTNAILSTTSWTNKVYSARATNASAWLRFYPTTNGSSHYVETDNVSLKPLTLSSLFSSVSTSKSDVIADVNVVLTAGTQAGLVLNLDSTSSPANFVIAYHDGTNVHLEKAVAGTYTSLINTAATYSAGATLRVIKDGTKYRVYYNNALVGSEQTISDAGIISNTKHGVFSTYSGNTFDNFTLWARGTGNEYAQVTPTDLTVTRDTTIKYAGSTSSAKIVAGTTDNDFTQSANVGDTSTYTLTAYVYTDGTAVTASDLSLYYDTNILSTIYSPVGGNGWYKLTGTLTGVASSKLYGVRVKAGKTVYVDNINLGTSSGITNSTLYVMNSATGVAGLDVQSTSTFHSGLLSTKGLIIMGANSQTANLAEWQNIGGTTLTSVTPTGLVNATTGGLATYVKAGTISDSDFSTTPPNGTVAIDSTDGRIYFRNGGSWSYTAKTGGFQIPDFEASAQKLEVGDYLIPYVEKHMEDGAVHGLYYKFSDVKDLLFASESARLDLLEANKSDLHENLNVLGLSTLNDASISGTLNVGILSFDNTNGINAIGDINFASAVSFNNNVVFANDLTIKNGILIGNDNFRGSLVLPSGSTSITVSRSWDSQPVSVVSKPRFSTNVWVTDVSNTGFVIHTSNTSVNNEIIDWSAIW